MSRHIEENSVTHTGKTLVLAIGNVLLRDEGAGIHVLRRLSDVLGEREDVELMDGGTLSFTLAGAIEEADRLIVLDAANLDAPPGTTCVFVGDEMDAFVGGNRKRSVHEVGLIDLMAIARLTDRLPGERALVGIQPHDLDWGESPSPAVSAAIPVACQHVLDLLETWHA
jgi:hydrogenase maturation protease